VSEQKSFTKAADSADRAAGWTPDSPVEQQLKVQLLVRHSRGVDLTDGRYILEHARDILERIELARPVQV
jgi:hypothetical protein